jgi:hypothetical protein
MVRTVADLPGTFAHKQVKGRIYRYYQFMDVSGGKRQVYVGPENERVLALIARRAQGGAGDALQALAIALPADVDINTHAALESLQMGLLPIEHADGGTGATYLDPKDPEFQIDFLTPLHRGDGDPFRHPQLGIKLQPLQFMEYLLQDVQQAAVLAAGGVCVANVPSPARYALHKLIVAGERPASRIAKSNKDVQQAASILLVLREQAPWQVDEAWADLVARGPGWRSRVQRGRDALRRLAPELDAGDWLVLPAERAG